MHDIREASMMDGPDIAPAQDDVGLDRRIMVDIWNEVETEFLGKSTTLPEVRRMLALKGYRLLHERSTTAIAGLSGPEAVAALAWEVRAYALEKPGLAMSTWRTPDREDPELWQAAASLGRLMMTAIQQCGLSKEESVLGLRMMRALARGFVMHELGGSYNFPADRDESYRRMVAAFIAGLPTLRSAAAVMQPA